MIAAAIVTYAEQASGSRVPPSRVSRLITTSPTVADPGVALAETAAAPDPGARLADFNPPQKGYRDLREELKRLIEDASGRARLHAIAPALDPGLGAAQAPLIRANLEPAAPADPQIDAARRRASGRPAIGAFTASADAAFAIGPLARRRAAILANMEMWRWEPRDMGDLRIEINVPDFSVSVRDGDTVLHRARVVVGKPDTPTPIFSNVMSYVLINPSWQVPDSIIRREMLPKLASDPDYLSRHGYEVKTIGGRITVRQPPGEDNALGRIAFMFPNQYSVYMHDTPSRALFAAESRAFSHGCVRVDEALRLAELVLGGAANGWPARRISAAIGGAERTVFLSRPLPIHIEYFTEFVNEFGELRERPDVYGLTRKVADTLSSASQD
jgi:murein L,D-transpeptidase YcbB/YkuD